MISIIAAMFLASSALYAGTIETVWNNPACETGPCDLKAARYSLTKTNDLRYRAAGNSLVASFETTSKSTVKNYAFVQYIKGCHFAKNQTGNRMGLREFFGNTGRVYQHTDWEIDSAWDKDPIYSSFAQAGFDSLREYDVPRNASYLTANPTTARNYDWWSGKEEKLNRPEIFMSDEPTFSSWVPALRGSQEVITSVKFRTCLHEIKDVPHSVEDPRTIIPDPIHCYEWSSNYQMNSAQTALEEKPTLAAFCGAQG